MKVSLTTTIGKLHERIHQLLKPLSLILKTFHSVILIRIVFRIKMNISVNDSICCNLFTTVYFTDLRRKLRLTRRPDLGPQSFTLVDESDIEQFNVKLYNYQRSGLTLAEFFDVQIVHCFSRASMWHTSVQNLTRRPIFVGGGQSSLTFKIIKLSMVHTTNLVTASPQIIARMYGLYGSFSCLTDFYRTYPINFKFFRVDDKTVYESDSLPGENMKSTKTVYVGKSESNVFYWFSKSYSRIKKRYYCTRFPGVCTYWSTRSSNTEEHEKTCVSETKINAKQVSPH